MSGWIGSIRVSQGSPSGGSLNFPTFIANSSILTPYLARSATLACLLARSASPARAQVKFILKTD